MAFSVLFPPDPRQKKNRPLYSDRFLVGKVDSNHRRRSQQIYSLSPLATREFPHMNLELVDGLEPPDLLITNQLLYQLSYTSASNSSD